VPAAAVRGGSISGGLSPEGDNAWGRGGLVCGRLVRVEQWCMALDQAAASVRRGEVPVDDASDDEGAFLYVDLGNSILAVDEIAFVAMPPGGLRLALVDVVATPPSHPLHNQATAVQRVVLLQRPTRGQDSSALVEPVLATVSRDAALWDINEVLDQHLTLRAPRRAVPGRARAAPEAAAQTNLASFQEMLQGLKAARIPLPPGVTTAQLKREVAALVASTREIQDDDVLLHGRIESLLQQRLREKGLDALLALQAAWRRRGGDGSESAPAAAADGGELSGEAPPSDAAAGHSRSGEVSGEDSEAAAVGEGGTGQEQWEDAAADAMERASAALEQKSAEVREKRQNLQRIMPKAGWEFEMDLQGGTVQLRMPTGSGNAPRGSSGGGAQEGGEGTPQEAVDRMLEAAMAAASGGSDEDGAQTQGGLSQELQQAVQNLLQKQNVLEKLREEVQELKRGSISTEGGDGNNAKMQVRLIQLDDTNNIEAAGEQMQQVLQAMMAMQGAAGGDSSEVSQGDITEAFRTALASAQASRKAGAAEEEGEEVEA